MTWFYLTVNCIVLVTAGLIGWRTRGLRSRALAAVLLGAAGVMAGRLFLHAHPEYEQYLLRLSDDYLFVATWEAPAAALLLMALAVRLRRRSFRRVAVTTLLLLSPLFVWDSIATCLQPEYVMAARFDEDGTCIQSTDYSCGPAAAVTMLRVVGKRMSEGEMSRLCLLRPNKGVTALELCRGLNIALRSTCREARIHRVGRDGLDSLRVPFLAEIQKQSGLRHCIMVFEVARDSVVLSDPALGRYVMSRPEFLSKWTGLAITIESIIPAELAWK